MTGGPVSIKVPFRVAIGDPDRCYEAAMQSVLLYYYPDSAITLDELDRLVGRKPGFWTWTCQLVPVMDHLGVSVEYFSEDDLVMQSTKENLIKLLEQTYRAPGEFERVLAKTEVAVVTARARECLESGLYLRRRLTWNEIETRMENGQIPMILLDYNILVSRPGPYQGHFVVVTGFDERSVFYHENSEKIAQADRTVPKADFVRAWDLNTTGRDVVFATGRKNQASA